MAVVKCKQNHSQKNAQNVEKGIGSIVFMVAHSVAECASQASRIAEKRYPAFYLGEACQRRGRKVIMARKNSKFLHLYIP